MEKTQRKRRLEIISQWQSSGKTAKQYSAELGINHHTFYGWLKEERKRSKTTKSELVQIPLTESVTGPRKPLVLEYRTFRIHLESGFDPALLADVLSVLERSDVS